MKPFSRSMMRRLRMESGIFSDAGADFDPELNHDLIFSQECVSSLKTEDASNNLIFLDAASVTQGYMVSSENDLIFNHEVSKVLLIIEAQSEHSLIFTQESAVIDQFVSLWNTQNTSTGSSNSDQIRLPLVESGTYDFDVDWGDSSSDTITLYDQAEVTHTYASAGEYELRITGTLIGFKFEGSGDRLKLLTIEDFGPLKVGTGSSFFEGCANLVVNDLGFNSILDLSSTSITDFFRDCTSLTDLGILNVTSNITVCGNTFFNCTSLTVDDLSNWDTSALTSFSGVFRNTPFNGDVSNFSFASGCSLAACFRECQFNHSSISTWDVSNVSNLNNTFNDATLFNQDISGWDTSSVTNMSGTFSGASSFNQNLGGWNIEACTTFLNFLLGGQLSTSNYNSLLNGWAAQTVPPNKNFHAGDSQYTLAGSGSRAILTGTYGWTITDGGLEP